MEAISSSVFDKNIKRFWEESKASTLPDSNYFYSVKALGPPSYKSNSNFTFAAKFENEEYCPVSIAVYDTPRNEADHIVYVAYPYLNKVSSYDIDLNLINENVVPNSSLSFYR